MKTADRRTGGAVTGRHGPSRVTCHIGCFVTALTGGVGLLKAAAVALNSQGPPTQLSLQRPPPVASRLVVFDSLDSLSSHYPPYTLSLSSLLILQTPLSNLPPIHLSRPPYFLPFPEHLPSRLNLFSLFSRPAHKKQLPPSGQEPSAASRQFCILCLPL